MDEQSPLKRRMLTNPSTGYHRAHPLPHPSQLNQYSDPDFSQTSATAMQTQLDQAAHQLLGSSSTGSVHVHQGPALEQAPQDHPPKPKSPVIIPPRAKAPQPEPVQDHQHLKAITQKIAEDARSHIPAESELERIKQLNEFKPVIIGTILFIFGLVLSAVAAIIFGLF